MNESKEVLEATIKGLEEKVSQLNDEVMMKKKELEDINKPEMTEEMYETLESCIIEGVQDTLGNLTQDDCDVEFGMEYDGKVYLESININDPSSMADRVLEEIHKKFKIVDKE